MTKQTKMTKQEVYNKVVKHLLEMQHQSVDPSTEICKYRGPDGGMCAIGCLIPDELYDAKMEGDGCYRLLDGWPSLSFLEPHRYLLADLQDIHDGWAAPSQRDHMILRLIFLGLDEGLDVAWIRHWESSL